MARAPKDEFGTVIADTPVKPAKVADPVIAEGLSAAAEARTAAKGSAAAAGGTITDNKYTPPVKKDTTGGTELTAESIQKLIQQYTKDSIAAMTEQQKTEERLSAYNILRMEFEQYGLGSLVTDIKDLLMNNTPPSEFSLRLRESKAYQDRFKANEARIAAGLAALSPAEYVALEDQYQNVMRNYGLPKSYYTKDQTGKQVGFEKFIAGDVSATELENRIITAQDRVINANPEVSAALKAFYPDITNGDILAYTLDPQNALKDIQRKVTAAEIGGAAIQAGLTTGMSRAEQLAAAGINKAEAQQGFQTVAQVAPRGSQLAEIYKQQPYGQTEAEQEVFNLAGSVEAQKQRKKLAGLEQAAFGAKSGAAQGALQRERAGNL